jgi:hypothetical protein
MTAHNAKPMPAGTRFGRLVIIREADAIVDGKGGRRRAFTCRCDCGNETTLAGSTLRAGHSKSCGCLFSDTHRARTLRLGQRKSVYASDPVVIDEELPGY